MPRWICPFCFHTRSVNHELIGELKPCESCDKFSEVIDADLAEPVALFREWQLPGAALAKRVLAVLYAVAWLSLSLLVLAGEVEISGMVYWLHLGRGFASAIAFLLVSWPVRAISVHDRTS